MSGYRRPFRAYPYSVLCNPLGQHAVPPLPFPTLPPKPEAAVRKRL